MKIGIVTNLYPPHARGGAENVIVRIVEQLLAMGHDVFVVTGQPKAKGVAVEIGTTSIERIYRFFPKNIYFTLDDYRYSWPFRLLWHVTDAFSRSGSNAVAQILADEKPDIVLTNNLKGIGLRIPEVIQAMHIPHVHILHDLQLVTPSGLRMFGYEKERWFTKPVHIAYRMICRARMGKPSLVLSPSQYLLDEYQRAGFFQHTDVRCMPNPSPSAITVFRDSHRSGPLRLLFVGQLALHKGIAFLLNAFAKFDGDIRLHIAGGGQMRAMVEERVAHDKRIVYLGYTPPEELAKCMIAVDAVVVPSLCYENSPTVIYESLSVGVPLVASRIGGVGELIQHEKTGFLFTPGDEQDFLRVLQVLDAQKDDFATRSAHIRGTVAPYEITKYTERLVALLTETIARYSRR